MSPEAKYSVGKLVKRSKAKEGNFQTPIPRQEMLSYAGVAYDAFVNYYASLTGKIPQAMDVLFCRLQLGEIYPEPYREMSNEQAARRNEIYRDCEKAVLNCTAMIGEAIKDIKPQAKVRAAHKVNHVAYSLLTNLHGYLFWGEGRKFNPESTSDPLLKQFFESRTQYEEGLPFRARRKQRRVMEQMKELTIGENAMIAELNQARPEEVAGIIATYDKWFTELGLK